MCPRNPGKYVFPHTGSTFTCKALTDFLRSDECEGFAKSYDSDDPDSLLGLYVHTKYSAFMRNAELVQLTANDVVDGIEILPVEGCTACTKGKLVYKRLELASLPKLPRHWGCRCSYIPWLR